MALPPSGPINWSRFPSPEKQWREGREKGFILDGNAMASLGCGKRMPRLWGTLPPYNAQLDPHTLSYFWSPYVQALLKKTGQGNGGTSAHGWIVDYNNIFGTEQIYLNKRNWSGAGHSRTLFSGHSSFLSSVRPPIGYNGRFGYRRNTPSLRSKSSCFGEISPFSFH
ncbi:sperm microtubule associated protein 1 isoform 1-T1 [Anomaloglossus baeobatrachus]|uniref:sperm microtubule associated protein 1 isoform X1 n=1 Tax=Anomaloglossus baeobatrachus TaxID=238106 RepID=UPI003F50696B